MFSVTLNSISESVTPELTDEWVDSNFGISDDLHTVDQLRSYLTMRCMPPTTRTPSWTT